MIYLILMGLLSIGIALFAVQNSMAVEINFMFWTFTTSLVLVILGCFVSGIILGGLWILKIKTKFNSVGKIQFQSEKNKYFCSPNN